MSMTMLPVAEARDQLSRLINDAQVFQERFQISRNGRPAAVLLSQDDFAALIETIEIMADPTLAEQVAQGVSEDRAGQGVCGDELAARVRALGRPHD